MIQYLLCAKHLLNPPFLMCHVQFYLNNKKLEHTKILIDRGFITLLFDLIK